MTTALELSHISVEFGGVLALDDVSFELREGEVMGLIGPNGAGKTTLINVVSRLYRHARGDLRVNGHRTVGLRPHDLVALGVARTFQAPPQLSELSVEEVMLIGSHSTHRATSWRDVLKTRGAQAINDANRTLVGEVLERLHLADVKTESFADLPYASQKLVDLGRALCQRPTLLLLDEPCAGLSATEKREFVQVLREIREDNVLSIVLVEHDIETVLAVSDRVCVLSFGRKIAETSPDQVMGLPEVRREYLGKP